MTIRIVSPTKARLEGYESRANIVRKALTYHDKKVDYEVKRLKKPFNFKKLVEEHGSKEAALEFIKDLNATRFQSLLFEDSEGLWTYSGLAQRVANQFNDAIVREVQFPEHKLLPWQNEPDKKPRDYQIEAHDALMAVGHGAVEMGTGLGKSFILQLLTRTIGLKTVIMAPSVSIARQLFDEIEHHFGKKKVGLYGDGKKDFKKQIVVGIGASLTRIEKDSPTWEELSKAQVFIADESHQTPAKTLADVCFGLLENAPYRFFFSGTQIRNDGLDLVLEGITGPIVYRMTVQEGVDKGWLAKPLFTMFEVDVGPCPRCDGTGVFKNDECHSCNGSGQNSFWSEDSNALTRAYLFYNPKVIKLAADIANKSVRLLNRPVLILVEEMEQFTRLLPYLEYEARFAHGGVTKDNAARLPEAYHDSDPKKFVAEFNEGTVKILVGTSCIATGTDIKAAKHIIYLRGGASAIEVRQSVGRGTRLFGDKKDCYFTDFDVVDVEALHRHSETREAICSDIYAPVRRIKLKRLEGA